MERNDTNQEQDSSYRKKNYRIQVVLAVVAVLTLLFGSGILRNTSSVSAPSSTANISDPSSTNGDASSSSTDDVSAPISIEDANSSSDGTNSTNSTYSENTENLSSGIHTDDTAISEPSTDERLSISYDAMETASMHIVQFDLVENFRYDHPDPDDESVTAFIDFQYGIFGNFAFSWKLTEQEGKTLLHTGKLFDADGQEIYDIKSWAYHNGTFAAEFPTDLPAGTYRYELILHINGRKFSDTVSFNI